MGFMPSGHFTLSEYGFLSLGGTEQARHLAPPTWLDLGTFLDITSWDWRPVASPLALLGVLCVK